MFRRFRCFVGLNRASSKRLLDARPPQEVQVGTAMLETVQEIAVYIHRFHNLDLFQQGWYQIKISMRWEDSNYGPPGTPARVVQYEAPDLGSDDVIGVWSIDDEDHSFTTQPFKIKYARQDVFLAVMISFNLADGKYEIPSAAAVILKFELLYAPALENSPDLQASLDVLSASVHEFRVPPKALLGLHSYCPVHFDAFHAVLVDLSVHIVLLKAGTYTPSQKVSRDSTLVEESAAGEGPDEHNQIIAEGPYAVSKVITLIKALLFARGILLEELLNLSKVINQPLEDLTDAGLGETHLAGSSQPKLGLGTAVAEASEVEASMRQMEGKSVNDAKKQDGIVGLINDTKLASLSKEELLATFHSLGNQLLFMWNAFLKFHRANRTAILDYLRDVWVNDRRAEWSIWMVHSKIDIPTTYLRSGVKETSLHSTPGKVPLPRRSGVTTDDPAQASTTRAELHRRSIAQMKINNRTIQDMHIFEEPLHIPVVLVEKQVINVPQYTSSNKSSPDHLNQKTALIIPEGTRGRFHGAGAQRNGRILKVVVFVHGFQGHHLDLRLVRNQWLLIDPGAECLMSEANEDKTSGDFREMGGRLSNEVVSFLKKKIDKASRFGGYRDIKVSFVGHSIGNIIIRSALTDRVMEPYLKYLHTYMSVSGPHLGYLYNSNSLFNSGLWLLKKLKGAQCIHQLTFTDDPDLHNTFLYKLCKEKTLEYFKNIILLSSPQDGYVPHHSARIELCQAASFDYSKKGQIFMEMLNNCIDQIRAHSSDQRTFMRCDVNFDTSSQGRSLNTFIGRAAHIEFLETDIFARFVMWSFSELFI